VKISVTIPRQPGLEFEMTLSPEGPDEPYLGSGRLSLDIARGSQGVFRHAGARHSGLSAIPDDRRF
jgi:hypothetical protein